MDNGRSREQLGTREIARAALDAAVLLAGVAAFVAAWFFGMGV